MIKYLQDSDLWKVTLIEGYYSDRVKQVEIIRAKDKFKAWKILKKACKERDFLNKGMIKQKLEWEEEKRTYLLPDANGRSREPIRVKIEKLKIIIK